MAGRSKGFGAESRRLAEILIPAMRERARRLGYALGVHGSLEYDIDLIAAPWTDDAVHPEELFEKLRLCCESITGFAYVSNPEKFPEKKPHGRLAWSFHLGGGPYIDLSVMPRLLNDGLPSTKASFDKFLPDSPTSGLRCE